MTIENMIIQPSAMPNYNDVPKCGRCNIANNFMVIAYG